MKNFLADFANKTDYYSNCNHLVKEIRANSYNLWRKKS